MPNTVIAAPTNLSPSAAAIGASARSRPGSLSFQNTFQRASREPGRQTGATQETPEHPGSKGSKQTGPLSDAGMSERRSDEPGATDSSHVSFPGGIAPATVGTANNAAFLSSSSTAATTQTAREVCPTEASDGGIDSLVSSPTLPGNSVDKTNDLPKQRLAGEASTGDSSTFAADGVAPQSLSALDSESEGSPSAAAVPHDSGAARGSTARNKVRVGSGAVPSPGPMANGIANPSKPGGAAEAVHSTDANAEIKARTLNESSPATGSGSDMGVASDPSPSAWGLAAAPTQDVADQGPVPDGESKTPVGVPISGDSHAAPTEVSTTGNIAAYVAPSEKDDPAGSPAFGTMVTRNVKAHDAAVSPLLSKISSEHDKQPADPTVSPSSTAQVSSGSADPVPTGFGTAKQGDPRADAETQTGMMQHPNSGVIQIEHVLTKMTQSEIRVGINSNEFGNIDLQATVARNHVSATLLTDHAGLRAAIAAEMPTLEHAIAQHQMTLDQLHLDTQTSSGQQRQPRSPTPTAQPSPTPGVPPVEAAAQAEGGPATLGARAVRLNVHA